MPENRISASHRLFGNFATAAAVAAGSPIAFILAVSFIVVWILTGPLFHYSKVWNMTIEAVPTLVTFLLVFLIQHSQNRETLAVQLKLNELIRATDGAHNLMVNLEKLTEEELRILCTNYEEIAQHARRRLKNGIADQAVIEISVPEALV